MTIAMKLVRKILNFKNKEFIRFCFVGGLSTIINYGLFFILLTYLNLNYLFSSASGYISGTIFGFFLNKKYTFKSKSKKHGVEIVNYPRAKARSVTPLLPMF